MEPPCIGDTLLRKRAREKYAWLHRKNPESEGIKDRKKIIEHEND